MDGKRLGVAAMGGSSAEVVSRIELFEQMGISAAWLTTGGTMPDGITLFSAAAVKTNKILMGTCITPTYPRHPLTAIQQIRVVTSLAPGRFRLGLGPSHRVIVEPTYGYSFGKPITNLKEYIHIIRSLINHNEIDFDGHEWYAHAQFGPDFDSGERDALAQMPIMASALRPKSYEVCGAVSDGAISWVCPGEYLNSIALPSLELGAQQAGRATPPLVAHAPVCVHDNLEEGRIASREQLARYPKSPLYQEMFAESGHPEARNGLWSDGMLDDVVFIGDEETVTFKLKRLFDLGATEIIAHPVVAGGDPTQSLQRTLNLLASLCKRLDEQNEF